jgi:hypothetical protein
VADTALNPRNPALDRFRHGRSSPVLLRSNDLPDPEDAMSADNKTPFEQVNDVVTQLKEMRHYSKHNVEQLTTQWLLFDGELSKLKQAERIEQLMTQQGQFYDALEEEIATLEELAVELKPAEEDNGEVH